MIKFMLSLMYLNTMLSIRRSWIFLAEIAHQRIKDDNEFAYYDKWGMGIPQSLRAFARMIIKN